MPTITDWRLCRVFAEENVSLLGYISGHPSPSVGDMGRESLTSQVIGRRGQYVVTQSGTEYDLLKPHPSEMDNLTFLNTLPEV